MRQTAQPPMNEAEVAQYLLDNPGFFDRHAELLDAVRLGHAHGTRAVSLHERQLQILRDKNRQLERRLAELLRYGHENDSIAGKFGRWVARVLAERDTHALPQAIADGLREIFDVPLVALRLWNIAEAYSQDDYARCPGEEVRIFANSLSTPYCGANTGFEAANWLGRDVRADGSPPASVALIALRDPASPALVTFGLLVMGSPDPARFNDGMGTDFLVQIGTLASAALSRLLTH
jgi:uncharacterized protein YigA (DUF484 family)